MKKISEENLAKITEIFSELRKKHDIKIVTATQLPRERESYPSRLDLGGSDLNIIIIDHLNLI